MDQNGTTHAYDRNVYGRLTSDAVTLAAGSVVDDEVLAIGYAYTDRGELFTVTSYGASNLSDPKNQIKYERNGFGQVTSEWQEQVGLVTAASKRVQYSYVNGFGNSIRRQATVYPSSKIVSLEYNGSIDHGLDRVSRIVASSVVLASYQRLGADTFVRTSLGNGLEMTAIVQTDEGVGDGGDKYSGIDRFGRLQVARWIRPSPLEEWERIEYGFDRANNIVCRRNALAPVSAPQDEHYEYDELYQLKALDRGNLNLARTSVNGTPTWAEAFDYDPLGNWLRYETQTGGSPSLDQGRLYNAANQLLRINDNLDPSEPVIQPAHDAAGNLTRIPTVESWTEGWNLTWDAWNRLATISGASEVARYFYDGSHRRCGKSVEGGALQRFYLSDQWQVLEEWIPNGGGTPVLLKQFGWGIRSIDDLVSRDTLAAIGSVDQRVWPIADGKNVTAVAQTIQEGTPIATLLVQRFSYTAFGESTVLNATFAPISDGIGMEIRFSGYWRDSETGLHNVRFRYYHPELGRWLSRDPLEEEGGLNVYEYGFSNPLSIVDLDGLVPKGSGRREAGKETSAGGSKADEKACGKRRSNADPSGRTRAKPPAPAPKPPPAPPRIPPGSIRPIGPNEIVPPKDLVPPRGNLRPLPKAAGCTTAGVLGRINLYTTAAAVGAGVGSAIEDKYLNQQCPYLSEGKTWNDAIGEAAYEEYPNAARNMYQAFDWLSSFFSD
jgi:RHS repeat-associated protein